MSGYAKLYRKILNSSVWSGTSRETKIVWVTLLAMKDRNGRVISSLPGLAKATELSVEECEEAIAFLSKPDPYSRCKDHEGRRLIPIDGGWEIVTSDYYDNLRELSQSAEAIRKREERERKKQQADNIEMSHDVTDCHNLSQDGHGVSRTNHVALALSTKDKNLVANKPRPAGEKGGKERGGWVGRLTTYHDQTTGASIQPAHVGKVLKPLVERYGEERVFTAWQAWCAEEERFSVNYFASHFEKFDGVSVVKSGADLFPGMYFKN